MKATINNGSPNKVKFSDVHEDKQQTLGSTGNEELKTKKGATSARKSSMGSLNLKKISSANSKTTEAAHEEPLKSEPNQPKSTGFFDEIDNFFTNLDKPATTHKTNKPANNTPKSNNVKSNDKATKPKHEYKVFDVIAIALGVLSLLAIAGGVFIALLGL